MSIWVVVIIAVGLSMDAFAVAVACSIALHPVSPGQVFRIAFHFGLFQALMPVLGWLLGHTMREYIMNWDHWIAFLLLAFIGGNAIYEALAESGKNGNASKTDPTRGMMLLMYSVATSIDALAVGISLAMIKVNILFPCLIIGVVTAILSMVGMMAGSRIGARFGREMEIFGGVILIGIGLKILISHIFFGGSAIAP